MQSHARIARSLAAAVLLFGLGCGHKCASNAECAADQVCASGDCVAALSASYTVTLAVAVAATEPDGSPWDSPTIFSPDGSPPDPTATLAVVENQQPVVQFDTVSDSFFASWSVSDVRFDQLDGGFDGGPLELDVVDADSLGQGDPICQVFLGPESTVQLLHAGSFDGGAGSCTSFNLAFNPQ